MPREDGDIAIVQAARTSYGQNRGNRTKTDRGLIHYLIRNKHSSPLEMVVLKFFVRMPIFVHRQWVRHRIARYSFLFGQINEHSGRYAEMPDQFYLPDRWRERSTNNKQIDRKSVV